MPRPRLANRPKIAHCREMSSSPRPYVPPVRTGPPAPVTTPCIQVCTVDAESGLCLGCFRDLKEIGGWSRLSESDRKAIMSELPARRSRIRPEKLALF